MRCLRVPRNFEVISSDFERLAHQIQRKTKRFATSRPNVGECEPSVGLLLFTMVHEALTLASVVGQAHCCSVVTVNNKNTVQLPTLKSSSSDLY